MAYEILSPTVSVFKSNQSQPDAFPHRRKSGEGLDFPESRYDDASQSAARVDKPPNIYGTALNWPLAREPAKICKFYRAKKKTKKQQQQNNTRVDVTPAVEKPYNFLHAFNKVGIVSGIPSPYITDNVGY